MSSRKKTKEPLNLDDFAVIRQAALGVDSSNVFADVAPTMVSCIKKTLEEIGFDLSLAWRFPRYPIGFDKRYLPAPVDIDPPGQQVRGIPAFFLAAGYDPQGQGQRLLYLHNGELMRFGIRYFRTPGLSFDEPYADWEQRSPASPLDWFVHGHRIAQLIDRQYDFSKTPRPQKPVRLWYFPSDASKPAQSKDF